MMDPECDRLTAAGCDSANNGAALVSYFHHSGDSMSSISLVSSKGSFHGDREPLYSPTPTLPTEVWHYIASLMPFSSFKKLKLYAVNKDLLGYYLKEEYRDLRLGFSRVSSVSGEKTARLWSQKVAAIR
jgi:hypothetical protein